MIVWLEEDVPASAVQEVATKHGWDVHDSSIEFIESRVGEWLMPGFVDTHTVSDSVDLLPINLIII